MRQCYSQEWSPSLPRTIITTIIATNTRTLSRKSRHDQERHEEHARRIEDEHFRAHFGHEHHFAVRHVEVVEGRPRFEYSGYRFEIAQPWPVGWAYTDDVYIDFVDGGYYMFNLRHPGVRVAVTVLP